MTHASCKANKVMTDSEHSQETSHNVQKCHDHKEETKSDEKWLLSVSACVGGRVVGSAEGREEVVTHQLTAQTALNRW